MQTAWCTLDSHTIDLSPLPPCCCPPAPLPPPRLARRASHGTPGPLNRLAKAASCRFSLSRKNTFQVRKHLNRSDLFRCVRSDSDEGEWDEHDHHDHHHYTISGPDMEMWLAQQCALPCLSMAFNCLFTASFLLNFHCLFAAFNNLRAPSHRRGRQRGQVRAHSLPLPPAATPAAAAAAAAVSILIS